MVYIDSLIESSSLEELIIFPLLSPDELSILLSLLFPLFVELSYSLLNELEFLFNEFV